MDCSNEPADIAVVVVARDDAATIDECLARLRMAHGVAEIRVVDNNSRDGTLDIIQRHAAADGRLRFIGNPDNPGIAVACNQGAASSGTYWLAFVNPGLLIQAGTLQGLRSHAEQVGAALLGVDLVDGHGRPDPAARRRAPDITTPFALAAAIGIAVPRDPEQVLQPVEAISGGLMFLPRRLFERLGGFDEAYRGHLGDLDLCRRACELGALVAVANDFRVTCLRDVSPRARSLLMAWHEQHDLWRYFRKFESGRHLLFVRLMVPCLLVVRMLAASVRYLLHR